MRGPKLTKEEAEEIARRAFAGERYIDIAAGLGRGKRTVQSVIQRRGGIPPRNWTTSDRRLSRAEREEISRGLVEDLSFRKIAERLGRAPSTVSREVNANGGRRRYRAWAAERAAYERARRPKAARLATNAPLRAEVEHLLGKRWSPRQVARRLRRDHPCDPSMWVSHETVYQSLFVQSRGALRKELTKYLRTGRPLRRPQARAVKAATSSDRLSISERPPEVEDRAVPGHWEGDLLIGRANGSAIGTLVERWSRFVMLFRLPHGHDAESVLEALVAHAKTLPRQLALSLTWDRGPEMAAHARFTLATGIVVYFCDPHSPWQRGTNENTNGLLRQYLPKGTDLSVHTQADLDAIAAELNDRPRQTLDWMKPSEKFAEAVAMTA